MNNNQPYFSSVWRFLACAVLLTAATTNAATLGGPMTLEDEGAFFVNGKIVTSNYPGASLITGPPRRDASRSTRCTCTTASRRARTACPS